MLLQNQRIGIMGFGKSGISAAKLAFHHNARIFVSNNKDFNNDELDILDSVNAASESTHSSKLLDSDLIIVSPGISYEHPILKDALNNSITLMPEIEFAYNYIKGNLIAVTGTNGKSTTAHLIYQILKKLSLNVTLGGNISPGQPLSDIALLKPDCEYIVCELSSFQLEHIHRFRPHIAIITNISDDHFDRHNNIDNYLSSKMNIFKNQDSSDFAIINIDDELTKNTQTLSQKITVSSQDRHTDIFYNGKSIIVNEKLEINLSDFSLPGIHNIYNLMQAVSVVHAINGNIQNIESILKNLRSMPHRMEFLGKIGSHNIYNNSMCTNPIAFKSSVISLSKDQTIILGGRNKDFDIDIIIETIINHSSNAILIGETAELLFEMLQSKSYKNVIITDSLNSALIKALKITVNSAPINFSPGFASFDMFNDFADRGDKFKNEVEKLK
ncbi:UDP-N-acetylmuramoyl-L-alanine--D-glutamate ligase [candidate division WOR-3 bacterium]|nr:UDP-N-acetylmuramoyl-L-alanine--D-glutamate ligase [candidate division WOR-3 bacterium]